MSSYPTGFLNGVTIRELPILNTHSGKVYWVNNTTVLPDRGIGGSNGNDGTYLRPFSTIDYAIGKCTAGRGDIIMVMPGHAESVTAAGGIALDVSGVAIVGLGQGELRPIITFATATAASVTIDGNNTAIKNLVFKCNIASQSHMLDITATDVTIEDCEFREGSATGLSFITADTADADSDRLHIQGCKFYAPTAGNMDNAIQLAKDFIQVRILDCEVSGDFDDACIHLPAGGNACLDLHIKRCVLRQLLTNVAAISINGTGCSGVIQDCLLITDTQSSALDNGSLACLNVNWADETDQVSATPVLAAVDSASNILGADDSDNAFASTNVAANENGSIIERLEQIQEAVNVGTGTSLASNKSLVDALGTDGTTVSDAAVSVLGAVGANNANNAFSSSSVVADVNGSVLERLEALMDPLSGYNPRLGFRVTKVSNLADGAGTDDLFTVTGRCLITSLTGEVTTVIGGAATLKLRDITNSVDLCAATTIDSDAVGTMYALTSISANILNGTGATPVIGSIPNITGAQQVDVAVVGDVQAALTISQVLDAADTGAVTWTLFYIPLVSGATVAAAA